MNTAFFANSNASTQRNPRVRDTNSPLKRTSLPPFQFDPASMSKNLKNIFVNQNTVIDRLFSERDDLVERVHALEERLASSLSMIGLQKTRIVNLSDLSARLSAVDPIPQTHTQTPQVQSTAGDRYIVEQLRKINVDQIPVYLAHNPFAVEYSLKNPQMGAAKVQAIVKGLPAEVAVEFAAAAFAQMYRASEVYELVQTLRKSIHNPQFLHKIESFCCKLFKAGFCQIFALQPQQNRMVALFDNEGFTLQVPVDKGIVGSCAKEGKVKILQSTVDATQYDPEIDDFFSIGTNPSLLIPVFDSSSNFVIAVILAHSPKAGALFTPEDLQVGEVLSSHISPFLTSYVEHMEKNEDRTFRTELSHAVKTLLGKNTLDELLLTVLSVVQRTIQAEEVELYLTDNEQEKIYVFEPQITQNDKQQFVRKYFSAKVGIPYHVVESLSVFSVNRLNPEKCEYFSRETDVGAIGKPYVAVPVFGMDQKPVAVLAAYGKTGSNFFSPLDIAALQQIGVQIGVNLTNIFNAQEIESMQKKDDVGGGGFDRPLRCCQAHVTRGSNRSIVAVCEAVAREVIKQVNCDLIGIWEVSDGRVKQRYILKSQTAFGAMIDIPPCVTQVTEGKEMIQSAIAADVKQMIGTFDDDIGYKSYSNVTYPVISNDKVRWVIMAENSMAPQGRFGEGDCASLGDYATFLLLTSDGSDLHELQRQNAAILNMSRQLVSKLVPVRADLLSRLLDEVMEVTHASHYGLYQMDSLSDAINMVISDYEDAPKAVVLNQGLLGKVMNGGDTIVSGDIYGDPDFNLPTDAFGIEEMNSGVYMKFGQDFVLVLLAADKGKFKESDTATIAESAGFIIHGYEISRNFNDMASNDGGGVSVEQRAIFMSKASSPTRSDLEEFSDRLFNIVNYGEDERVIMILKMFVSQGVIRKLQVPFQKLVQFVCAIRGCYNDTPYHNWTHACDVAQFAFSCITRGRLRLYLQDIELFALLLAAISHDVDHNGFNNAFHKKARSPLGILYDERPVMEMHHAATALRLLEMPEHNVLEGIETHAEKSHFYEFFTKIILATDMDKHFAYIKEFEEMSAEFDKRNERHRLLLAQIVMKCGDVSNTTRAFDVASDMAHKLTDEFFRQGDNERTIGIEVTPMCDRTKASHISTSQVGFYGFIASPLLAALGNFVPALADNTEQLEKNKRTWEQQKLQWETSQKQ